jgi:hypothetical protein
MRQGRQSRSYRYVMLDAGGRFRRREVLAGRLEEIHCSLICE